MAVWAKTIEIVSSPDERNPYIRIVLNFGSHHMCLIDIVRFARAEMYLNWKPVVHRSLVECVRVVCVPMCVFGKNRPQVSFRTDRLIECVVCVCVAVDFQVGSNLANQASVGLCMWKRSAVVERDGHLLI